MKRLLTALYVSMLTTCVQAATYYVAPIGNNGNPGTSASPWLTLQKAANTVQAGDTVIVRAGNYAGFYLSTNGTSSAPITFTGEPGAVINTRNVTTPDGINLEPGSWSIIEGFRVINQPRTGIRSVTNDHVIIRNNICLDNAVWGILTGFSENILIEGNETARSVQQHGIYVGNSADHPTIRNNVSHDNSGGGIQINSDVSQGGDGIITDALIENNVLYNNGVSGGAAINLDGLQNSVIRNNLLYNNHATGITLFLQDGAQGPGNNKILFNTIDQAADGRWCIGLNNLTGPTEIRDNILINRHSVRGSIHLETPSDVAQVTSSNNIFGGNNTHAVTPDDDGSYLTLSQWQAMGKDQNSFVANMNALWVNTTSGDYHLKAGSPAIDTGVAMAGITGDIENALRPFGSAPDMGCYEYGSTPGTGGGGGGSVPPETTPRDSSKTKRIFNPSKGEAATVPCDGSAVKVVNASGLVTEISCINGYARWAGQNASAGVYMIGHEKVVLKK